MTQAVYKSVCLNNQSVQWNYSLANGTACREKENGTIEFRLCKQHIMQRTEKNLLKYMKYLRNDRHRVFILFQLVTKHLLI